VALAKAQASSTEAIEAQKTRVSLALKKLTRVTSLAEKDIVSRDKFEGFQADYEIAERDLNLEMLKHHLAEIEAQRAEAALNLRILRSPVTALANATVSSGTRPTLFKAPSSLSNPQKTA
jgi:multidrug resistance efflux pump